MFYQYYKALQAAKSIGLTDRGRVQFHKIEGFNKNCFHRYCNTRLRIGIDGLGNSFIYCWRCEQIVENSSGPIKTIKQQRLQAPKTEPAKTGGSEGKVIKLEVHRSAPPTPPTAS